MKQITKQDFHYIYGLAIAAQQWERRVEFNVKEINMLLGVDWCENSIADDIYDTEEITRKELRERLKSMDIEVTDEAPDYEGFCKHLQEASAKAIPLDRGYLVQTARKYNCPVPKREPMVRYRFPAPQDVRFPIAVMEQSGTSRDMPFIAFTLKTNHDSIGLASGSLVFIEKFPETVYRVLFCRTSYNTIYVRLTVHQGEPLPEIALKSATRLVLISP